MIRVASKPPRDCPCHSGARYVACCAPYHKGEKTPPTPEALMRSRYAAFALGLGEYLVDTLSDDHEDRAHPREQLALALAANKHGHRFMGLEIREASAPADDATVAHVTFHARIFEKGKDQSFTERSRFVKNTDGVWRYASGELLD